MFNNIDMASRTLETPKSVIGMVVEYAPGTNSAIASVSVFTCDVPKHREEYRSVKRRNERYFFVTKKDSHYAVFCKDYEKMNKKFYEEPLIKIAHGPGEANREVWKNAKEYISDLGNHFKIKKWLSNGGKLRSLEDLIIGIRVGR